LFTSSRSGTFLAPGARSPAPAELQELGRSWLVEGKAAMLSVPPVVVPTERNYLLNPAHPGFKQIHIGEAYDFSFDPRTWKGK
jgi:RES domain-containing protein